jgi:hypothetical protein
MEPSYVSSLTQALIHSSHQPSYVSSLTQALTQALIHSYVSSLTQALLRSAHRAQEGVLYDFLSRLYESQAAQAPERC